MPNSNEKIKRLMELSAPLAGAFILNAVSDQATTYILSQSSTSTLATSGLSVLLYNPTINIGGSALAALPVLISKYYGEGNQEDSISTLVKQGWVLSGILAIPQAIILGLANPILPLLQQPDKLIKISSNYFYLSIASLPAVNTLLASKGFAYGTGKMRVIIALNAFNLIVGSMLLYGFMLGPFGLPKNDFDGYAYAITTQAWLNTLFLAGFLKRYGLMENYNFFTFKTHNFNDLAKKFLKIGSAVALKTTIAFTSTIYKQVLIGKAGEISINAYQVVNTYNGYIAYINDATNLATNTLIGESFGKKDFSLLSQYYKLGLCTSVGVATLFAIPSLSIPEQMTRVFFTVDKADEQDFINQIFYISAAQSILDAISQTLIGAFLWTENAATPVLLPFINFLLVTLPITMGLYYGTDLGTLGIATGYLIGSLTQTLAVMVAWNRKLHHIKNELETTVDIAESLQNEVPMQPLLTEGKKSTYDALSGTKENHDNSREKFTDLDVKSQKYFGTNYLTTFSSSSTQNIILNQDATSSKQKTYTTSF